MATRFYLPSGGTPPLSALAKNSAWELEGGIVRLPTKITKQDTALSTSTRAWPNNTTQQWCWYQFQSEQLSAAYSWTTSDTVSMVLGKLAETSTSGDTHLNYNIRVVSQGGTVIRGIIGALQATAGSEFPLMASAATKIFNAATTGATNFSSQIGDRIIIEIGTHGVTPAAENIQLRIGDPSATADFALTAGLTTDLVSWVELSRTVTFGAEVAIVESGSAVDTKSAIFTGLSAKTETTSATDSFDGVIIKAVFIVEPLTAIDTSSGITDVIWEVSIEESSSIVETSSVINITTTSTTESVSIIDTSSVSYTTNVTITETSFINSNELGGLLTLSDVVENITVSETISATQLLLTTSTNTIFATDNITSISILLSNVDENSQSLLDEFVSTAQLNSLITEETNILDFSNGNVLVLVFASVEEIIYSEDYSDRIILTNASISEDGTYLPFNPLKGNNLTYLIIYDDIK